MIINEKAVDRLRRTDKRQQFMDDTLKGFGVRVEVDGRKTFFWSARVNARLRFKFLGEHPAIPLKQAREEAKQLNGRASAWRAGGYQGPDPFIKEKTTVRSDTPTFLELFEAYVTNQVRTEANHPEDAEQELRWWYGKHFESWKDRKIDSITVEDVLTVKNNCGKHQVAANRCVQIARRIFNWSANSRNRFLQPDEMNRFEDELTKEPSQDLKDFLVLALDTGARKLDVLGMKWSDVQWERSIWSVPDSTKSGEAYDAPLEPLSLAILEARRKVIPDSSNWVFPGPAASGHLMDVRKPWTAFRERARIPDIRPHDLRRTRASYQSIAGQSMLSIAKTLGQRSLKSTEVYARLQTQAVIDSKAAGTAKMHELMAEAKKRAKKAAKKPKLLKALSA